MLVVEWAQLQPMSKTTVTVMFLSHIQRNHPPFFWLSSSSWLVACRCWFQFVCVCSQCWRWQQPSSTSHFFVRFSFHFGSILDLPYVNASCRSCAPAVNIKDDSDTDFPSISSYVLNFSCFRFLFSLTLYFLRCSILAESPTKRKMPSHKTDMRAGKIKDDRPGSDLPPVTLWDFFCIPLVVLFIYFAAPFVKPWTIRRFLLL